MPLNFTGQVDPQIPGVIAQEAPATGAIPPRDLQESKVKELSVTGQPMSETGREGVKLAKAVLGITAGSILLLVAYLLIMEWMIGSNIREAYCKALDCDRAGSEIVAISTIDNFIASLTEASKNEKFQMSAEAQLNADQLLKLIDKVPSISNDQKNKLKQCNPLPADNTRKDKLDACLTILGDIRKGTMEAAAVLTRAQVAGDSVVKIGEQRQNLHLFWVQAAQLVLLNLLLPLLTALFGYIFGTQQQQARSS
jgi:hypothetical protein